ncbi:sugar phosphate isomerase/epimerase [Pelagicoccus sp. SDUM812005]|uniref:sugar phosphate isomerase/epimerase family protein n=1 Tax=Pelagicoccus sp. SDUM812005 TaxID=3041257 RepID=UPI00280EA139|nr:sugar phosphate isomerase/epimerase [Pelagicoccus sp. SDUM812005]MDQ8183094.1 sugar phosphate isomerase/epimerase [Pelagicoccus sp. SDUM812005]
MEFSILSDEISLDIEEALQHGAALGFRKYEIRCIDDYEHRIPYFKPGREQYLQEKVDSGEIEVTAVTPGVFKIDLSDPARVRKELDETLPLSCEMAVRLKAPTVIVFGFMRGPGSDREQAVSLLKEAASVAKKYNLKLAVENEPGSFCDTGAATADIVEEIGMDHVGINWDPGNALTVGEVPFPIGYERVRPYLQNMHIKDTIPIPPDKWENRLVGDGGVNWIGQLQAVIKDQALPFLTIETHVFPVLESTREELRRLKIYLETIKQLDSA